MKGLSLTGEPGKRSAAHASNQGMLKCAAGAPETRCAQTVRGVFPPPHLSIPKIPRLTGRRPVAGSACLRAGLERTMPTLAPNLFMC